MKESFKMKFQTRLIGLGALSLSALVGFQNCGQGFSAGMTGGALFSSAGAGKVLEGNAVKEANLSGKSILSNDLRAAAVGVASATELVSCSSNNSSCLASNMSLLSQLKMPTPNAGMFCAPTSAGMLFDAMLNSGVQFPRNEGPEFMALGSSEQRVLWLGQKFQTDANGTYPYPQTMAIDSLAFAATPGYELKTIPSQLVTPEQIKEKILLRSIAALNYGHFKVPAATTLASGRRVSTPTAEGGHAVAVSGFRTTAVGETEIIYNDPWDATQYSRVFTRDPLQRADGVYVAWPFTSADGAYSPYAVFKWSDSFDQSERVEAITFFGAIQPRALPNAPVVDQAKAAAQAVVIDVYRTLLGRLPESAALDQYTAYLLAGNSRAQMEDQIRASEEYKNRIKSQTPAATPTPVPNSPNSVARATDAIVTALFKGLLQRAPEPAALDYASSLSCQAVGEMVAYSEEAATFYRVRDNGNFILYLYQGLLGRTPDLSEIRTWQAEVDSARLDRNGVIDHFLRSPEFKNRCVSFGVR
jgi:Domain of unknown function (DUF4214)